MQDEDSNMSDYNKDCIDYIYKTERLEPPLPILLRCDAVSLEDIEPDISHYEETDCTFPMRVFRLPPGKYIIHK